MSHATPAGRLVAAFGKVEAMTSLYAPEVSWSLPASIGTLVRPMKGREAVIAFNHAVWRDHYHPDCEVEILDETGNERSSAVRFIYRARLRSTGGRYENEYTLFARCSDAGITEVFEMPDTLALYEVQRLGAAPGDTLRQAAAVARVQSPT